MAHHSSSGPSLHEKELRYMETYDQSLSLWPVSYESLYISTRFGAAHVLASGPKEAPPLVLLHGYLFSSTMWFPNVAELAGSHRVYAIDIINDKNKTEASKSCITRADFANWLFDILHALGIEQANFAGLSYGAAQIMNFIHYFPNRVEKAVLMSPAEGLVPFHPDFYHYAYGLTQPNGYENMLHWMMGDRYVLPPSFDSQYRAAVDWQTSSPPAPLHKDGFPYVFTDEELRKVSVPMLLLLGQEEVMYNPFEAAERATKLIRSIRVEMVEGAGHVLTMEKSDEVNKRMASFFQA